MGPFSPLVWTCYICYTGHMNTIYKDPSCGRHVPSFLRAVAWSGCQLYLCLGSEDGAGEWYVLWGVLVMPYLYTHVNCMLKYVNPLERS